MKQPAIRPLPLRAFNQLAPTSYTGHLHALLDDWQAVRQATLALIQALDTEDLNLQSMAEASPGKWHLAHTTWFFETFLLANYQLDYQWYEPAYCELFNSYYNEIGEQYARARRHLLSRPRVSEVLAYRKHVDAAVPDLLRQLAGTNRDAQALESCLRLLVLGLNHEQQHQELLITDLQHALSHNPLAPAICAPLPPQPDSGALNWIAMPSGVARIGGPTDQRFCFDNETPVHRHLLHNDYALSSRPINNAEYLEFINAGGYDQHQHWHSDGWAWCQKHAQGAPLYWRQRQRQWHHFTLAGELPLDLQAPVTHLNWYEASAYATWRGYRLPTETEWEHAAQALPVEQGQFAETGAWQPCMPGQTGSESVLRGMFGHVWEWTSSPYIPYPGYRQPKGAIGEYNGKFMANQYVLKGGSCASPQSHLRSSYRNFFYPQDRWQFTGLRLARDI